MIGQFLLAFRESLEAALIAAIILSYLKRTKKNPFSRHVWYGVYLAVGASLVIGVLIWFLYGSLIGSTKALFEGAAAIFAVVVLSSMIYWMATKGRGLKIELERRVEAIVTRGASLALASFSFIIVFREGLETVLFLTPFLLEDAVGTLLGSFLGIVASLALAYLIFVVGMKIDIRKFFYFTSIVLVLLAGGLAGYGVHELVEYSEKVGVELGWLGEHAYVLDIPQDSLFHHKGAVGSIFAVMFGYTAKAEWARVIVHFAYLTISLPLVVWAYRRQSDEKIARTLHGSLNESHASNAENTGKVIVAYDRSAHLYDLMNQIYFLGNDKRFRSKVVERLNLKPSDSVLNLCCGTGLDFPFILEKTGNQGVLLGVDVSSKMLLQAKRKIRSKGASLARSDAAHLPFRDKTFDSILVSFCLKITPTYKKTIEESARVLKPGGRVGVLANDRPFGLARLPGSILVKILGAMAKIDFEINLKEELSKNFAVFEDVRLFGGLVRYYVGSASRAKMRGARN